MEDRKVLLVVPAWNEAQSLPVFLVELRAACPHYHILVVNDGSSDATTTVAKAYNATVIDLPCNLGVGGAVQTGFLYAQRLGYDIVVRLDADGQHPPEEVARLIHALDETGADVVIGSRFLERKGYRSSYWRRSGIRWLGLLIRFFTRQHITDATSGFWACRRDAIAFLAVHYPQGYPEPEGVILLLRNGFRIQEVPIKMRDRQAGQSSIRGLKPIFYMLKVTLAILVAVLRRPTRILVNSRV